MFAALFVLILLGNSSQAQKVPYDTVYKPKGNLWGYAFGDFYTKPHSDSFNRGNANQYSGVPQTRNAFQFRRIYLGYDYDISHKFSVELLLAAEDNFAANNPPGAATTGDQLLNNKLSYYIKLANLRIKNIWKGTDLVVGQLPTPAFPYLSERIWSYRSIERTISDIRRTPSYDFGAALQGSFDAKGDHGYNLMVGNGSSAKPEADNFKWFYGDVYFRFMERKLVFDLYGDYERLNWTPTWHHDRQMIKAYIAYNTPALTIGVEGFVNNLGNDNSATKIAGGNDTLSVTAKGISAYIHGNIVKGKLRFFARFDAFNPINKIDNNTYKKYTGNTGNYSDNTFIGATGTGDQTYKQEFITAGLDWMPTFMGATQKNVHIMPNIWYNHYASQLPGMTGSLSGDYDLVLRITFYYVFGK